MVFIVRGLWTSKDLALKWNCCGPLQLVCWLTLALFVCLGSSLLAQPGDSLQQAKIRELKPAVWQFGNVGSDSQSNGYYHLQYSPNGRFLVARNRDNLVQVYDVKDRVQLYEIGGHESRILQIDFSPDSKYFVTSSPGLGEKTKVWSIQTGSLVAALPIETRCAKFSSDGKQLIVLGDRDVHHYDWPGGQEQGRQPWGNEADQPMTVSRDGRLVVSFRAIKNQTYQCQIYDIQDDSQTILAGPTSQPRSVLISENQRWMAAIHARSNGVTLWDLNDPHELKFQLNGHDKNVQSIAFSADNRFLLSTSWDGTFIVWDLLTRQAIKQVKGHTEYVNSCAISPLGLEFATGASGPTDSSVKVWSLAEFLFPVAPEPVTVNAFQKCWHELGSGFADIGLKAVNDLRFSIDDLAPMLIEQIGTLNSMVSHDQLRSWIRDLDDPRFDIREKATLRLQKSRGLADALLQEALQSTNSAEVRYRITRILRTELKRPKIKLSELRRLHRAVFLLELVDNEKALSLLNAIATQHPHIDVARDAAAAVVRLKAAE